MLVIAGMGLADAADERASSKTVVKTKDGLHFNLPADWPVEKRDGVVAPIPMEEYLGRKFSTLENRVHLLEGQAGSLDLRLRVMEEQLKKQQRLQSGEAAGGAAP